MGSPDEAEASGEWHDLFDGESLDGWTVPDGENGWTVGDGAIRCRGRNGGYLVTEAAFGDFDLDVEFAAEPGANSGVFVRASDVADPVNTGLEIQILDTHGVENSGKHDAGALYDGPRRRRTRSGPRASGTECGSRARDRTSARC